MIVSPVQTRLVSRFARFCVVGGSGVLVNSAILYGLHGLLQVALFAASPVAAEISVLTNFVLNNRWTFGQDRVDLRRLAKFNLVSLGGLAITTSVLIYLVGQQHVFYLVANLFAVAITTLWNFALNLLWTWRSE